MTAIRPHEEQEQREETYQEGRSVLGLSKKVAKATWTAAVVLMGLYSVWLLSKTLLILALSICLSYMIFPLVRALEQRMPDRLPHALAIGIVFAGLLTILAIGLTVIGPAIGEQATALTAQLSSALRSNTLADNLPLPSWLSPYRSRMADFIRDHLQDGSKFALPVLQQAGAFMLGLASNLIFVVVVPVLSFLLMKEGPQLRDRFDRWAAGQRQGTLWLGLVTDLDLLLGHYMRALLLLSLATTLTYSAVFILGGLPFGLFLACVSGVLEFVPVFGPLAAAALTLLVAGMSGYEHILGVAGFIGVYRLFQDYVLNPYLMSDGVEISPLLVILGLLAGDELAGVAGIFLSIPLLASARILVLRVVLARPKAEPGAP